MIRRNKKTGLFMTVRFPAAVSLAILLGGLLSSSVIAQTEPIVSTLEEIGFFGTWAIRCDAPASLENVVRSAYVSAAGEPGFSEDLGSDLPENTYRILAAQRDGDNQIVLEIELNAQIKQRLTMVVDGNRIRTLTNTLPDGRELVHNGIVTATDNRTPWLNRCETTEDRQ
jgi:hypothetical protein